MPTLKQIKCSLELGSGNIKLKEYGAKYGDGTVQTFIAVPDTDIPFTVHVETEGYIAPGISLFVFMDGEYQCNRNRIGLKLPGPGVDTAEYETDFRMRQKEEKTAYGSFVSRRWSFARLQTDAADKLPALNPQFLNNLGSIEIVLLRCQAPPGSEPKVASNADKRGTKHDSAPVPSLDGAADDPYGEREGRPFTRQGLVPPTPDLNNHNYALLNAYAQADRGYVGDQGGFQQVGHGVYDPGAYYGGYAAQTPMPMAYHPAQMQQHPRMYAQPAYGNDYGYSDGDTPQLGLMDDPEIQSHLRFNKPPRPQSDHEVVDRAAMRRKVAKQVEAGRRWREAQEAAAQKKPQDQPQWDARWGDKEQGNQARKSGAAKETPNNPHFKSNVSEKGSKSTFRHGWDDTKKGNRAGVEGKDRNSNDNWANNDNTQGGNAAQNGAGWPAQGGGSQANAGRRSADKGGNNNGGGWQQQGPNDAPAWEADPASHDAGDNWGPQAADNGSNGSWGPQAGGGGPDDDPWTQKAENNDDKKSSKSGSKRDGEAEWGNPQTHNNQGNNGWGDNNGQSWGNGSVHSQKSASKGSQWSARPSASVTSAKSRYLDSTDPKSLVKPYWKDWKKPFNKIEGEEPRPTMHAEPRPVLQYPEQPLPVVPSGKTKAATHGVQLGKGSNYAHLCRRPLYLDTMEAPYAVFSFKYRSKEVLEKILKIRIDAAVDEVKKRAEKDELLSLPKEQLVEELLASRK